MKRHCLVDVQLVEGEQKCEFTQEGLIVSNAQLRLVITCELLSLTHLQETCLSHLCSLLAPILQQQLLTTQSLHSQINSLNSLSDTLAHIDKTIKRIASLPLTDVISQVQSVISQCYEKFGSCSVACLIDDSTQLVGARSDLLTPYIPAEQYEELIKCDYLQHASTVQSVVYSDECTVIKLPVNNSLIIISIDSVARSHL